MRITAHQVVITGAGLATPLGLSVGQTWDAVRQGRCGIGPMPALESQPPGGAQGGQAPDLPGDFEPTLGRESRYLRWVLNEAMSSAGMAERMPYPRNRCGCILGTTLHGMRAAGQFIRQNSPRRLKDFLAGSVMAHAIAPLKLLGICATNCSACSSSLGSIALAVTLLESGELDLVIAGGYDTISEYVYGGFTGLRLISPAAPRPFSRTRQGMNVSEGYGMVVLERASDAAARGARALATILGYGESADSHHLTQPHPQGRGAASAIEQALRSAQLSADQIDLIAAHATGTPDNDAAEYAALSSVFGDQLSRIGVVAFKSHLGHTLGGAGAVELILSMMALRDQTIPACASVRPDECAFEGLNVAAGAPRASQLRATLNTSLGFGGANTAMILGAAPAPTFPSRLATPLAERDRKRPASEAAQREGSEMLNEVLITGIGVVLPRGIGTEAFVKRLSDPPPPLADSGPVAESDIAPLLSARRVRRMSQYVKLSLAATMLCLKDAGVADSSEFCRSCAAVLGTTHGSTSYSAPYYRQIVSEGIGAANPMQFAEGVPNAAAAHLSLMFGLQGPCQSIIGSRTAGLDALRFAAARIRAGEWDRAVVGAAEEFCDVVNGAYGAWGLYGSGGYVAGCGAVSLLLESRSSMETRAGRAYGRVLSANGSITAIAQMPRLARQLIRHVGSVPTIIISSNGTWIDRVEAAACSGQDVSVFQPYLYAGECFSVLPLVGISGALLGAVGGGSQRFATLVADYAGSVSAASFERIY